MSRLCAGCASQNSVLVVRFTAKCYICGVLVPSCVPSPARNTPKRAPQTQNFALNNTTSTLFWLAQPAHSRLFVPAQQNTSLRSSPASNFIFLRVSGSRGKSKMVHGVNLPQFLSDDTLNLAQAPFGFAHCALAWTWFRAVAKDPKLTQCAKRKCRRFPFWSVVSGCLENTNSLRDYLREGRGKLLRKQANSAVDC